MIEPQAPMPSQKEKSHIAVHGDDSEYITFDERNRQRQKLLDGIRASVEKLYTRSGAPRDVSLTLKAPINQYPGFMSFRCCYCHRQVEARPCLPIVSITKSSFVAQLEPYCSWSHMLCRRPTSQQLHLLDVVSVLMSHHADLRLPPHMLAPSPPPTCCSDYRMDGNTDAYPFEEYTSKYWQISYPGAANYTLPPEYVSLWVEQRRVRVVDIDCVPMTDPIDLIPQENRLPGYSRSRPIRANAEDATTAARSTANDDESTRTLAIPPPNQARVGRKQRTARNTKRVAAAPKHQPTAISAILHRVGQGSMTLDASRTRIIPAIQTITKAQPSPNT